MKEGTVLCHLRHESEEALEIIGLAKCGLDKDLVDVELAVVLQPITKLLALGPYRIP